jgi:hypothetical protein
MQPFQDACCRLTTVSSAILVFHFIIFLVVPNLPSFQHWVIPALRMRTITSFTQPVPTSPTSYTNSSLLSTEIRADCQIPKAVAITQTVKVLPAPWLPQVAAWLAKCPSPPLIRIPEVSSTILYLPQEILLFRLISTHLMLLTPT